MGVGICLTASSTTRWLVSGAISKPRLFPPSPAHCAAAGDEEQASAPMAATTRRLALSCSDNDGLRFLESFIGSPLLKELVRAVRDLAGSLNFQQSLWTGPVTHDFGCYCFVLEVHTCRMPIIYKVSARAIVCDEWLHSHESRWQCHVCPGVVAVDQRSLRFDEYSRMQEAPSCHSGQQ